MGLPAISDGKPSFMVNPTDMGRADSLRYNVISLVREEAYEQAVTTLNEFVNRPTDFPQLARRVQRYIEHSIDLVRAIEMKRNFPGANRLTAARQQDLKLKVKQHIDELVYCLKKVEQVEISLRVEDVRSTVLVIHAIVLSVFAIAVVAFVIELSRGLMLDTVIVVDDIFQEISNWVYKFIG